MFCYGRANGCYVWWLTAQAQVWQFSKLAQTLLQHSTHLKITAIILWRLYASPEIHHREHEISLSHLLVVLHPFQLHLHRHHQLYHHPFVLATIGLCIEVCKNRKLQIFTNAKRPYFIRQVSFFSSYRYCAERVSYVNALNEATGIGNRYLWDKIMTLYNVHHLSRKSLIMVEYLFIRVLYNKIILYTLWIRAIWIICTALNSVA